jgi:ribonuclease P protein component
VLPAAPNEGFSRQKRLLQAAEFKTALRSRRRERGAGFIVIMVPNQHGQARLGIVVGRKALPRAVDRNRFKRLVREQFRKVAVQLQPLDIVVQAQGKLALADLDVLPVELSKLLRAAGA